MKNQLLDGFFLNDLRVEPVTGTVSGPDHLAHLPSKAIEVLLCLAQQPRTLVTHDEILSKVWGQGRGGHDTVSHAISEIRHALGDHATQPLFIQTVPKRGYRLLVEPVTTRVPDPARDRTVGTDLQADRPFWKALLRHGVVHASVAYLVVGWALIQVADTTFLNLGLPAWAMRFVTFAVIGGFPVVVLLSWFLESKGGRLILDRGEQSGGIFQGLERNYLAVVVAYGVATLGAGIYQYTAGFEVPENGSNLFADAEVELIPVEPNSVAVLQLLNIDGSEETQIFSDGLSEDVLDRLAALPGLLVSSRGDAWSLPKNASSDVVRRRLRVSYFLEGSVRIVGNELRVVAQLINSETGFHIVSRSVNRKLEDFLSVQREITDLIVANLRVALPEESQTLLASSYESADLDAYVQYRRGKDLLNRPRTPETISAAIEFFRQSLQVDPGYAAAHAGLCTAFTANYELSHDASDIDTAEDACAAALSANARLNIVHAALGRLYLSTGRVNDAEKSYLTALKTDVKNADAMLGLAQVYQQLRRADEAEALLAKAVEVQPGSWNTINTLGNFLFRNGRYEEAATQYRKVVYLDPDNFVTLGNLGGALMMAGDFEDARIAIEGSLAIEKNQTIYSNLGIIYYYLGEFKKSVAVHREVVRLNPNSNASWINLADSLYFDGQSEAAEAAYRESASLSKKLLEVNSTNSEALMLLAWAQFMAGEGDRAPELIWRAIGIAPSEPYAHYYDALLKVRTGDLKAATDAIRNAIDRGYPVSMLAAEPFLNGLRHYPKFEELLEKTAGSK